MSDYDIPFNRMWLSGEELPHIEAAIRSWHAAGNGPYTQRCEAILHEWLGAHRVLLTPSCTDALEMASLLLNLEPGDEVIVPSFTFVSTANAFALRGARPVFADIRPDTLNIDEARLADLVTERTRAVVVVHYGGVGCEMDAIAELAAARGIAVVEDNAHGLGGKYRGRALGTLAPLATQSFHETKNVSCGEGGALVVNDPALVERAEIIREKGTDRARFLRGQIDKYSWVDLGSSFLTSDVVAAHLYGQLLGRERIQSRRAEIWQRYADALGEWAARSGVGLPHVPEHCEQAFHLFYLLMPSLDARTRFIRHLRELRLQAVFHYVPLHTSTMGRTFGGRDGACPVAEDASDRLVRLPFFTGLTDAEQDRVIDAVLEFSQ